MQEFSIPTAADQFEYLLRVYFGSDSDRLSSCIRRAYRDLNRTIHGVSSVAEGQELFARASGVVRSFLNDLANTRRPDLDQASFDNRHRVACTELSSTYSEVGFSGFRVGQAQKWLNMALKYVFVFGEDRLPGYAQVYHLAHVPLDNIILNHLRRFGLRRLAARWSRILRYEDYMSIQSWIRSTFPNSAPLAVEFGLWQNTGSPLPKENRPA